MANFKCQKCGEELQYFDTIDTQPADGNGGRMIETHLMYCVDCDTEYQVTAIYNVTLASINEIKELKD